MSNLGEVFEFNNLKHILQNSNNEFVVLALTTDETEKKNKKFFKKNIKKQITIISIS